MYLQARDYQGVNEVGSSLNDVVPSRFGLDLRPLENEPLVGSHRTITGPCSQILESFRGCYVLKLLKGKQEPRST